ncbi:MAG: hypothetical protein F4W98_15440 [Acidimicrobiales bacterium]|nr:hypothetical protein [Acidimicrobiales bacterium]
MLNSVDASQGSSESDATASETLGDLRAAAEWAAAVAGQTTLGGLLAEFRNGRPVPIEVAGEIERLLASPLPYSAALSEFVENLLAEAREPDLLFDRECTGDPPTLEVLARKQGLTRERVRQKVAQDAERVKTQFRAREYRAVRWAVERFRAEVGRINLVESAAVLRWRRHLGERAFEVFRWLSGYTYKEEWLLDGPAVLSELKGQVEALVGDRWLVSIEELGRGLSPFGNVETLTHVLAASGAWRDIGEGWLVRWDGPFLAKAERVLRLTCTPMTAAELVAAIGHGSEGTIKNQRGDRLIRVDKRFRLALPEWGLEEYEGITTEIRQRIERNGGVASKSAIIDEFTRDFGVSVSSIEIYLNLPTFRVSGDAVRLGNETDFVPRPPSSVFGALETDAGWGERHAVTENTLKGYSFSVNPHICWENGLRPGASLIVPLNGSASHEASVIWRTTNPTGTVDVGRVREWLQDQGVAAGTEVLVCPTPTSVTLYVGDSEIQQARHALAANASAIAPDIASMMEGL